MPLDLVEDPVARMRFSFEQRGDVLHVELWADAGAEVADHVHPPAEERFEVLDGDVVFRIDGRDVPTGAGGRVAAAPGARHGFRNPGPGTAHLAVEIEPGARFEQFFRDGAALGRAGLLAGPAKPRGWNGLLASADFLDRYGDIYRPSSPPALFQRLTVGPLARLARRRGARAYRHSA